MLSDSAAGRSDSAEVTSGQGQDACGYGCFWCVDVVSGVLSGWPSLGCCLVREVFCVGGSRRMQDTGGAP